MSKFNYFSENKQLRFDAISREKYINDRAIFEHSAMPAGRAEGKSELLSELIKQGVITEEQAKNYRN